MGIEKNPIEFRPDPTRSKVKVTICPFFFFFFFTFQFHPHFPAKPCVLRQNVQEQKLFKMQFYLFGYIFKAVASTKQDIKFWGIYTIRSLSTVSVETTLVIFITYLFFLFLFICLFAYLLFIYLFIEYFS